MQKVYLAVVAIALLLYVLVHTMSFGTWVWKKKNKLGSVAVYSLAFISVGLTAFVMLFLKT